MSIKLVISGSCGRMGRAIAQCALKDSVFALGAALEAEHHEAIGCDYGSILGQPLKGGLTVTGDADDALRHGDVLIEFTAPEPTLAHAKLAEKLRKPMVIGTTGLSERQLAVLRRAARAIPMVVSPNMSLGVNVLFELAALAAARLDAAYDIEVVESHHRHKKDAPSGTAKRLIDVLVAARKRQAGSIPVHAIRAGDIVGDHMVILAGPSERVELTHRAQSRDVFAQGALRAARFVARHRPGLYDMSHVLRGS